MPRKNRNTKKPLNAPTLGATGRSRGNRLRGQVSPQSAHIKVATVTSTFTTGATFVAGKIDLNPSLWASPVGTFSTNYQFYRIRNAVVSWHPVVGATTGGSVRIAEFSNPETIYTATSPGYTPTDLNTLIFSSATGKYCNIWETASWQVPQHLLNRRRWYSVDTSTTTSAEVSDRTEAAVLLFTIVGPATTSVGYFTIHFDLEYKDFAGPTVSPLLLSTHDVEVQEGQIVMPGYSYITD
jgi:hypothetical protein